MAILYLSATAPTIAPSTGTKHPTLPVTKSYVAPGATGEKSLTETIPGTVETTIGPIDGDGADTTNPQSFFFGRYSSPPLAAQTIVAQILELETNQEQGSGNSDVYNRPAVYIWRPSTQSVVGFLFDGRNSGGPLTSQWVEWYASKGTNFADSFRTISAGLFGLSTAVTCQDGDILVLEYWGYTVKWGMTGTAAKSIFINTANNRLLLPSTTLTYYTPPLGPVADMSKTEAPDTFSADGTVFYAPLSANLTKTEAPDTSTAGATHPVIADLSKTEAPDTFVGDSTPAPAKADLTKTEAPDTLVSAATMPVVANLTKTEAADTLVNTGSNPVVVNASITEAPDTTITDVDIVIQVGFTKTEVGDTVTANGGAPPQNADLSITETSDSGSATAKALINAEYTVTENGDILVADGIVFSSGLTAYLSVTEAGDYATADGSVIVPPDILCNLSKTEGADTLIADGSVVYPPITANFSVTEQPDTATITGSVVTPTTFYCIDDPSVVTPTAGTKSPFLPKATNGNAAGSTVEGTLDTFWGGVGNIVNRTVSATAVLATTQSYYFGRFSSRLLAAQTIPAQTWNYTAVVGESSDNANTVFAPVMYVWRPSNNSIVGFIFDGSLVGQTEWPFASIASANRPISGAAVTCLDGDILVVEAWAQGAQTTAAGVYLQTWRMTDNTSKIISSYPVQFIPFSALYLRNLAAASAPTAGDKATSLPLGVNTNDPGVANELTLSETPIHSPLSRSANQVSSLAQQSVYFGRFSSAPLAAQTIPVQAWGWEISCGETNDFANTYHWPVLYIWRPSTSQVVGYIFNASGPSGVEWRVGDDPRLNQLFTGASVDAQFGDILVLEVWGVGQQSTTGTYLQRIWIEATNSRIVSPYKLLYTTGPVVSFNITEGADTLTASGTLGALPLITANLTVTEVADAVTATSIAIITADFFVREDDESLIGSLIVPLNAVLSKTEAPDTISSSVSISLKADLTKTELPDTLVSSVSAIIKADFTKTEVADALISDVDAIVEVDLTITEQGDSNISVTTVPVSASLSIIEGGDTLTADGIVVVGIIYANLTVTETEDSLNATAAAIAISVCDLITTEIADSLVASASVIASAALTKTEVADSLVASTLVSIVANLLKTEGGDTLTSSTITPIAANLGKTEAPDTIGIAATVPIMANLYIVEAPDTILASGGTPSATSRGTIIEFGPDSTITTGTFAIKTLAARTYFNVKGVAAPVEADFTTTGTTIPYAITSLVDLIGPSVITRTNGIQADMDTAALGGKFGKQKLYIGAGLGNIDPVQGRLYQLIVRGAFSNASQVADIENYVAMKTGAGLPAIRDVEVRPGVTQRVPYKQRWYQFSPPPWVMLVLVSICISSLLAGCAIAANDKENDFHMDEVIEYLTWSSIF